MERKPDMFTIQTILSHMMNDPAFADAVFANAEKALVEYNLPADEIARFKGISRMDLEALASHTLEERKSLATGLDAQGRLLVGTDQGLWR
jgi:ligand-binding sensor domain-containing protein